MMLNISITNKNYIIDDREIIRGGISYMVDTLDSILQDYPEHSLYLIVGSDVFDHVTKWKDFGKIMQICNIIILCRNKKINHHQNIKKIAKYTISEDLTMFHGDSYGKVYYEETSLVDISSTELRKKISSNKKVSGLITSQLESWISAHKIY